MCNSTRHDLFCVCCKRKREPKRSRIMLITTVSDDKLDKKDLHSPQQTYHPQLITTLRSRNTIIHYPCWSQRPQTIDWRTILPKREEIKSKRQEHIPQPQPGHCHSRHPRPKNVILEWGKPSKRTKTWGIWHERESKPPLATSHPNSPSPPQHSATN